MNRSIIALTLVVHAAGLSLCEAQPRFWNRIEKSDLGELTFLTPTGNHPLGRPTVQHVAISADGNVGLVASKSGTRIWDLRQKKVSWEMAGDLTPAGMSRDGGSAFVTVRRGNRLFEILGREGCLLFSLGDLYQDRFFPVVPWHAAIGPATRQFAMIDAAGGRTQLSLWDVGTGVERNIDFKVGLSHIHSVAFSSGGDYLHLDGTRAGLPVVQGFLTYDGIPDSLIPRIDSVVRNGGFAHSFFQQPAAAIVGMADDQSGPGFVSIDRNQNLKIHRVDRTSPGYTDEPRRVAVTKESEATSASFCTAGGVPGPGDRKKVAIGYTSGSIAIWNWKNGQWTGGIRPHKSRPTTLSLAVPAAMQERMLIGYEDGSVVFLRNPKPLRSRTEREDAYVEIQGLLAAAGGRAATVRFPTMAADVTDDVNGYFADWFEFSDPTEAFLEAVNGHLYRGNAMLFRKLLDEPEKLFDATELIASLNSENLGRPPNDGLEFDLQMVKYEQRQLSIIIEQILPKSTDQRNAILSDINSSLHFETGGLGLLKYLGGRLWHYETEAVRRAYVALGNRSPRFGNEHDRRLIGFAVAFIAHGRSAEEYYQYVKRSGGGGGGGW